ncbi:MAG: hypothetical protein IJ266_03920 [Elusimicrobiaceae bacterium]|nr:hypothetical protein [Elusimicrobiaceae bacterium]
MGNKRFRNKPFFQPNSFQQKGQPPITSLLDLMEDNREFSSLVSKTGNRPIEVDVVKEIQQALKDISQVRHRPNICYLGNMYNSSIRGGISIHADDVLPFTEVLNSITTGQNLDVILVTPGGSAQTVTRLVEVLRKKFQDIQFILPDMSMSAGTIMVMSGNEIIMTDNARIGPIDPQVPNKYGNYVPAQSLLNLIEDIRERGEKKMDSGGHPAWTDIQILLNIDPKEIGDARSASSYSISLVKEYLLKYKFSSWNIHSDGRTVSDEEKSDSAEKIAAFLCNHVEWKSHGHGISRETATEKCKIKIIASEEVPGLDRAIKRFWELCFWIFQKCPINKMFISPEQSIIRAEHQKEAIRHE